MPDGKPNILVLWGDDIGTWNLSFFNRGMMGYATPNIDRLATAIIECAAAAPAALQTNRNGLAVSQAAVDARVARVKAKAVTRYSMGISHRLLLHGRAHKMYTFDCTTSSSVGSAE